MAKDKALKDFERQWFIDALLRIKALKNFTQEEIAKQLGITQPMISRMKSGSSPVPDTVIEKVCEIFKLDPPEVTKQLYDTTQVEEAQSPYGAWRVRYELLERNMSDIRRELSTVYDYIADLKEFNTFLKQPSS